MPEEFSFEERPDSQSFSLSGRSDVRRYICTGTTDRSVVYANAVALTASAISTDAGMLYRQTIDIEPDGWGQWIVDVPYGITNLTTGNYSFNFDTTGATVHITAAKEHVESYGSGGATGDDIHKGSIGVRGDNGVEGADIVIPALKFSVAFQHATATVDLAFAKTLAQNTGKTNSATFLGFAAGELLFLGATGADGSDSEANVTYNFAASENVTDLTFGDIASIVKAGHDLAWVEYIDADESGEAGVQPKYVHVERVYSSVNFASVFGWS